GLSNRPASGYQRRGPRFAMRVGSGGVNAKWLKQPMSDTPTTLREAQQFSLAEMFRWSLVFAIWFAFCGIVPTTIPGAGAGIVVMAALVAARYYWVRGPRVPARL